LLSNQLAGGGKSSYKVYPKVSGLTHNEIYAYLLYYYSPTSNTKGYGGKTPYTDSHNSATTAPSGRELYCLQFWLRAASPQTFGYTLRDSRIRSAFRYVVAVPCKHTHRWVHTLDVLLATQGFGTLLVFVSKWLVRGWVVCTSKSEASYSIYPVTCYDTVNLF